MTFGTPHDRVFSTSLIIILSNNIFCQTNNKTLSFLFMCHYFIFGCLELSKLSFAAFSKSSWSANNYNLQCHAGSVHEDGRGLPVGFCRQQRQILRRHQHVPGADQAGQGRRGGAHGL